MKIPFLPAHWRIAVLLLTVSATFSDHVRAAGENEIDIIIESRAQGQNHDRYREVEGEWSDSQIPPAISKSGAPGLTPQGQCGTRKFLFLSGEEPGKVPAPAAARFYPRVNQPGRYHVYVTWPTSANAVPVLYTVRHAGGENRFPLAQEGRASGGPANSNRWISLGAFDFATGDEQYVEMRVGTDVRLAGTDFRGQVVADSVQFTSKPLPPGDSQPFTPAPEPAGLEWKSSIKEATAHAARVRKMILVYFFLPGSNVSKKLEEGVFGSARVRTELARNYILVKLNMADNTALAAGLGVYRGGTVVVYTHDGTALGQISDVFRPQEFLVRLAAFSAKR